jgi:hypothetical protein
MWAPKNQLLNGIQLTMRKGYLQASDRRGSGSGKWFIDVSDRKDSSLSARNDKKWSTEMTIEVAVPKPVIVTRLINF